MNTNDILHNALHEMADAQDKIVPGSADSVRRFADENYSAAAEVQRLRQIITDAHGQHGTCYWGLGFMFSPDTMKEDCKVCAAKRQMKSIANGMS